MKTNFPQMAAVQSLNGTREQVKKTKALKTAKGSEGDGEADMMQVDPEAALGADYAMDVDL